MNLDSFFIYIANSRTTTNKSGEKSNFFDFVKKERKYNHTLCSFETRKRKKRVIEKKKKNSTRKKKTVQQITEIRYI